MQNYNTILFDFDGTIMNTMEGITRGVESALLRLGKTPPARSALTCFIGPPIIDGFMEFAGLDYETAVQGAAFYREYYRERGLLECEPYPGIGRLLERLCHEGCTVALATSKPQPFAEDILRAADLHRFFHIISGAGIDGSHNDKETVIRHALSLHPAPDLTRCVMVGDRKYDILGAHAVGLPCIGVLYGFGSRAEFEHAGADFIAEDVDALESLLLP